MLRNWGFHACQLQSLNNSQLVSIRLCWTTARQRVECHKFSCLQKQSKSWCHFVVVTDDDSKSIRLMPGGRKFARKTSFSEGEEQQQQQQHNLCSMKLKTFLLSLGEKRGSFTQDETNPKGFTLEKHKFQPQVYYYMLSLSLSKGWKHFVCLPKLQLHKSLSNFNSQSLKLVTLQYKW